MVLRLRRPKFRLGRLVALAVGSLVMLVEFAMVISNSARIVVLGTQFFIDLLG